MIAADYFLDHYGSCTAEVCACLKPGAHWFGRGCPSWQPLGATTAEELRLIVMTPLADDMIRDNRSTQEDRA